MKISSLLLGRSILYKPTIVRKTLFQKEIPTKSSYILCNKLLHNRYIHGSSALPINKSTVINLTTPSINPKVQLPRLKKKRDEFPFENFGANTVNVTGYCTAEQYDLESLLIALKEQKLYEPRKFFASTSTAADRDVLYASAKYKVGPEAREVFFFRSGSVVLWNFNDTEAKNLLELVRRFEKAPYASNMIKDERENVPATYIPQELIDIEGDVIADSEMAKSFFKNGQFYISNSEESFNHKYTLSDALSASVKLGIFESTLERYITSIKFLTSDLSTGRQITISRQDMLRKTGELFDLRHRLNLSSDLLDVPDFYWERDDLEALYLQIAAYYGVSKRTKVMNEKINHCLELAELIYHNLNDKHHIRLEWMIIILIMVEVLFEIIHFAEKYYKPLPFTGTSSSTSSSLA